MRRQQHTFVLLAIMAVLGLSLNLSGQVQQPFTGQTKADLISAAFSSYLSGDISQARQYLNRASQIDMEDVTIRRLLENLAPVPAPQPVIPIPATPSVPVVPVSPVVLSLPSVSASEQARLIAQQNGLSDAAINAALQPPPVAIPSGSSIPSPPPLPRAMPGIGKLDFSGFRENPRALPPSILASTSVVSSVTAPDPLAAFPNHLGNLPQVSPMFSPAATMPVAVGLASPSPLSTPNVSQQLAEKQQESDNLISQITQASIALSQAMQTGDGIQVQAREAELASFRNQLKIVDASVVQLKLANQAAFSTPTGSSQEAANNGRSDLIISGETIELFVMQDESFNAMYQVRQGGYILIPRVGRVPVAGMTIPSAESSVAKAFSQTMIVNPTIIIERPEAAKSDDEDGGFIYIMGEFKRPGTFRVPRGRVTTILNTIIQSGGETPAADLSRVRLMRLVEGRNLVEEIDVNEILKGGGLANDLILRDGDILHIPSKPKETGGGIGTASARGMAQPEDPSQPSQARDNGVFVTGRVKSPGFLALTEDVGMTAYTAILAKGGFAPFSNTKKVYVVREVGGGQKVHIPVNIRNVQHGLEPDVELQSKDIVVVPEKFFSL
jgi:protein involved in polysaccharide export with SLBB domain